MGVFILVASSCKKDYKIGNTPSPNNTQTLTDSRDGNVYKYVKIGDQYWMAENLKYLPSVVGPSTGSSSIPYYYVYGYNGTNVSSAKASSNYATYGVLYNWTAACSSCPNGWHLPSDAEWTELTDFVGGANNAGTKLKATSGWKFDGNGTDDFGFTALPCGYRHSGGIFDFIDSNGNWWSATEGNEAGAWGRGMYWGLSDVSGVYATKEAGFSVRCVRD